MADDDHSNLVSYPIGSLVRTRSASKSTDLVHRIEPDFGGFRLPSKRYRLITSIRHTLPYGWGGGGGYESSMDDPNDQVARLAIIKTSNLCLRLVISPPINPDYTR